MKPTLLRRCLALVVCGLATSALAKPLVVCTEASPEGFDIAQYTSATTADAVAETVFNRLVDFTPGTTDIQPGLATHWEISDGGRVYTFHLRSGVKFHTTANFQPTRTMNADDVLWSFQRQLDPQHPWHAKASLGFPYFDSMGFRDLLQKVEKLDDSTVRFTLKEPQAPFLRDMAMGFTSIYSAEYAQQLLKSGRTADLNSQPVGTGPFIFVRYAKDAQVRFKANPEYYKGVPPSESLILAITTDSNVRLQRLKANECQIAVFPKPEDIASIEADPHLTSVSLDALVVSYIAFNTEHRFLNDVKVREALSMAFDKAAYVRAMFGTGKATPGIGPYPPTLLGYAAHIKDVPYDVVAARALLKAAGVPQGQVLTLFTRNGGGMTNPNPLLGAQMLQADLAKVGITLEIRTLEWGELLKRVKRGEHDLVFYGWAGDNGDPDNFLSPNLSCEAAKNGENAARWCDESFDALLAKARETNDSAARAEYYRQAQQIFRAQLPWISLAYPRLFTALRSNVEGFHISPMANSNFATTRVR